MTQLCRLCNGDGGGKFNTYARCDRCDGVGSLPDDFDQNAVRLSSCACARCGGTHMFDAERQYAPACDGVPLPPRQTAKPQVSVLDVLDSFDVLKKVYGPWIAPINPDHDALVDKLVSERVVGTAKKRTLKP